MTKRVVVIGGTGGFGRHLVRGLLGTTDLDVIIAARGRGRAEALIDALSGMEGQARSRARAVRIDSRIVTAAELRDLGAFAVIDAAGPYQENDYRLARAAIAAGLHYVDLADARGFVAGFPQLDREARAAGVTALTGASSTPALSNAVLDSLTRGWRSIDTVEIAIAPGNQALPQGISVIRSILSYSGKPVRVFVDGEWASRMGWGMIVRKRMRDLGPRWLSLCETPDLDIVPQRFGVCRTAIFRAGLELSVLHLGLFAASGAVHCGLLRSLRPFAPLCRAILRLLSGFGTDRGGMCVEASGVDANGSSCRAAWSLIAEKGDGPIVPTLPALAILRALAGGQLDRPGAAACAGIMTLEGIVREFAPYRITTETVMTPSSAAGCASPFRRLLDSAFDQLPEPVRRFHDLSHPLVTAGLAEVTVHPGIMPRLICRLAGLPRPGRNVPVTVSFHPDGTGRELWRRRFTGRRYASTISAAGPRVLAERFGLFDLHFKLTPGAEGLEWQLLGWRLLGVPLPGWSVPDIRCCESGEGPRFVFDIKAGFPWVGPVIHYRGWLEPQSIRAPR